VPRAGRRWPNHSVGRMVPRWLPLPPLAEHDPAFVLVVAAPYAVPLVRVEGERQARLPYRAVGADRLGPLVI
jgi:hypothetical protein